MTTQTVTLDIARSKIIIRGFPDAPAKAPGTINLTTTELSAQSGGTVTVSAERTSGSDGAVTATVTLADGRKAELKWNNGETGTQDAMFTMPDAGTIAIALTAVGAVVGVAVGVITVTATKPGKINLTSLSQQIIAGQSIVVSAERVNGTDGPASVDYTLSSGATGTFQWDDGESGSQSDSITTDVNAAAGTITITLSNAQGASLGVKTGTVTLIAASKPGTVNLVTTSVVVVAGNPATITFARVDGAAGQATAHYSLSDGATGSIVWQNGQAGQRSEQIPTVSADAGTTLTVTLDSVDGATKGVSTGTIEINAPLNPGKIRFTQATGTVARGQVAALLAERVDGFDGPVEVQVTTGDLTAVAGVDYVPQAITLRWEDEEGGTKAIQVQTLGTVVQPTPGTIEFSKANYATAAGDDAPIVLKRIGGKQGQVSVTLDTFDGTARAGTDYSSIHRQVTWDDQDAADKTINVTTLVNAPPVGTTGVSAVITLTSPSAEALHIDNAPLGVSALKKSDDTDHVDLAICVYTDCVVIENCYPDSVGDYQGRLQVAVDGTTVLDQTDVWLWKFSRTRPIRQGFTQITPTRNWDPTLLPNYGVPAAGLYSFIGLYQDHDNGINGRGISTPYDGMGTAGAQFSIGILPGYDLPWALTGGADNWTVCRGTADAAAVWPAHIRDRTTLKPLDPIEHEGANLQFPGRTLAGHANPVTAPLTDCPYDWDASHSPGFNIVAYLSTASDYDLEEVLFSAAMHLLWANPQYQDFEKRLVYGQIRGVGWGLRSIAYAAKITPATHPLKATFKQILDNNLAHHWGEVYAPGQPYHTQFGMWTSSTAVLYVTEKASPAYRRGIAPWQDDFVTSVFNQLVRMGFTDWTDFRDYKAQFSLGMLTQMNYQMASFYNIFLRLPGFTDDKSASADQIYDTWAEIEQVTLTYAADGAYAAYADQLDPTTGRLSEADALAAFGPNLRGDTGSPTSYPANLQPAIAAAVDAGLPGAQAAWDLFLAHSHIDYTPARDGGNQFNILPQGT